MLKATRRGKSWKFYTAIAGLALLLILTLFLLIAWRRGGHRPEETGRVGEVTWIDRLKDGLTGVIEDIGGSDTPESVPDLAATPAIEEPAGEVGSNLILHAGKGVESNLVLSLTDLPFTATYTGDQEGQPVFTLKGTDESSCPTATATVDTTLFTCAGIEYTVTVRKR